MATLLNHAPVADFPARPLRAMKSGDTHVQNWIVAGLKRVRTAIGLWRWRARQRRILSRMTMHELRDIGITRGEALREYAKPFWQG